MRREVVVKMSEKYVVPAIRNGVVSADQCRLYPNSERLHVPRTLLVQCYFTNSHDMFTGMPFVEHLQFQY